MKVLFFGTPDFAVPTLTALLSTTSISVGAVITQPDRPAGRGGKVTMSPIKVTALQHSVPVFQPTSLRKEFSSLREELAKLGPFDVGVVVAFGQILPTDVLSFPRKGCLNIHPPLLLWGRGAAPIQRAIQSGDLETGISLMQMDEGLDTGAVYMEHRVPIEATDTGGSLHDKLAVIGGDLLVTALPAILQGSIPPTPQPREGVTYAEKIKSEECKIAWVKSADEIGRSIRAFSPIPGCFTTWRGKRLKVLFGSISHRNTSRSAPAGTVLHAGNNRIEIACGENTSLAITDLQLEGKKRMSVDEFLRGTTLPEGEMLGS